MDPADEIKQHIERLDALVEREGAFADRGAFGELYANRAGYMRFGIELLKAVIPDVPRTEAGEPVELKIDDEYLFESNKDPGPSGPVLIDHILYGSLVTSKGEIPRTKAVKKKRPSQFFFDVGCFLFLAVNAILWVAGVAWFFSALF